MLPPFDQTSTSASWPFGTLDNACATSAADFTECRFTSMMTSPRCRPALSAGTAGLHIFDHCAVNGSALELAVRCARLESNRRGSVPSGLFRVRCRQSSLPLSPPIASSVTGMLIGLAVAHHLQVDRVTGTFLSDQHLQLSGIGHGLAVEFGDDVSGAQAGFGSGRVGFNMADQRSLSFVHLEELGVVGSYVGDLNSDKCVSDFAVANQGLHRGLDDLRRNRKAHS